MGRDWFHEDNDSGRLPDGFQRVDYDSDSQTYTYKDSDGRLWEGAPGARYGSLNQVIENFTPLLLPAHSVATSEAASPEKQRRQVGSQTPKRPSRSSTDPVVSSLRDEAKPVRVHMSELWSVVNRRRKTNFESVSQMHSPPDEDTRKDIRLFHLPGRFQPFNPYYSTSHADNVKWDSIYELVRPLGKGGFASVNSVRDKRNGKVYACKTFNSTGGIERAKKSFETEVAIMRKLSPFQNPHMVHFVDAFTCEKNQFFIIMSPVAEENLQQYLGRLYSNFESLNNDVTLFLRNAITDLARGLAFIHETTVRHKDISSLNILVHNRRVLYADFGVAFDFRDMETSTTASTHPLYNFQYAAPELLKRQPRNQKSDIFSLGCVYFEIIARLFVDADLMDMTIYGNGVCYGGSDKLQDISRHGRLGKLCASMLRRGRDDRPSAANVALLDSWIDDIRA